MGVSALKSVVAAALIVGGAAFGTPAGAIVINDAAGDGTGPNGSVTLGAPFTGVVNILLSGSQRCSGTLISTTMVLTAQHCIREAQTGQSMPKDQLVGSASQFTVQAKNASGALVDSVTVSAFHETDATSNLLDGTDIAILELSSAIGSVAPIHLLDAATATLIGKTIAMAGFGRHGVGSAGVNINNADGTRRAAENVVDLVNASNIIETDFDDGTAPHNSLSSSGSSATPLLKEGSTAAGDSGGPLLLYSADLDEYLIGGVLSTGTTFCNPDHPSGYCDISEWTGIQNFKGFITELGGLFVDPNAIVAAAEPETLALFALTLAGVAFYRRRRAFTR